MLDQERDEYYEIDPMEPVVLGDHQTGERFFFGEDGYEEAV